MIFYDIHLKKEEVQWIQDLFPNAFQNESQIQTVLQQPLTQFSITLIRDPGFREAVTSIHANPNYSGLLAYELGWIVLVWMLRAWRLQKIESFFRKLWVQCWIGVLSVSIAVWVIPRIVWGEAYWVFVSHFMRAAFKHNFT